MFRKAKFSNAGLSLHEKNANHFWWVLEFSIKSHIFLIICPS